jgi:ankyrin repeat protein
MNTTEPLPNAVNLVKAIEDNDLSLVKHLISAGADVNQRPTEIGAIRPLGCAVADGNLEIVKTLLAAGAYPHGFFLLQVEPASDRNTLDIMSSLIAAGIDLNFPLEEADTILMKAAGRGELDFVKLLVEAGADVDRTNQLGESALLFSAITGWQEVYEYLAPLTSPELRAEAEKELPAGLLRRSRNNDKLADGFISAAARGELDAVIAAIKKGVNINAISAEGNTALIVASAWGHISVVTTLIEAGADLNLGTENYGTTPLMKSVNKIATAKYFRGIEDESRLLEVAHLLVRVGANVNARTQSGWNALMEAANAGSIEAVKLLIQAGADVNAKTDQGETALSRAQKVGHQVIVQLLRNVGAKEE